MRGLGQFTLVDVAGDRNIVVDAFIEVVAVVGIASWNSESK